MSRVRQEEAKLWDCWFLALCMFFGRREDSGPTFRWVKLSLDWQALGAELVQQF